jgi:hypothetical protein
MKLVDKIKSNQKDEQRMGLISKSLYDLINEYIEIRQSEQLLEYKNDVEPIIVERYVLLEQAILSKISADTEVYRD